MKFTLLGGGAVEAASPAELVEALRRDTATWRPEEAADRDGWMRAYAARAELQTGRTVRAQDEYFLLDIARAGLVSMPTPPLREIPRPALDFLEQAVLERMTGGVSVATSWEIDPSAGSDHGTIEAYNLPDHGSATQPVWRDGLVNLPTLLEYADELALSLGGPAFLDLN